jgi:hypothetical protein
MKTAYLGGNCQMVLLEFLTGTAGTCFVPAYFDVVRFSLRRGLHRRKNFFDESPGLVPNFATDCGATQVGDNHLFGIFNHLLEQPVASTDVFVEPVATACKVRLPEANSKGGD